MFPCSLLLVFVLLSSSGVQAANVTPNGRKAGIAGGQSYPYVKSHVGWWYDWTPNPSKSGLPIGVPMLWGAGRTNNWGDSARFNLFKTVRPGTSKYILAFNEPDFQGSGSSGVIDPSTAGQLWDQWIKPHGLAGALLISPAMAMQNLETWLTPFKTHISRDWDITAVHLYQNDISKVSKVVEHFAAYNKPLWITEWACVDFSVSPATYCNQGQVNAFIYATVALFESDSRIAAYSYSDSDVGPYGSLTTENGELSVTGQTYLNAISAYSSSYKRRGSFI